MKGPELTCRVTELLFTHGFFLTKAAKGTNGRGLDGDGCGSVYLTLLPGIRDHLEMTSMVLTSVRRLPLEREKTYVLLVCRR